MFRLPEQQPTRLLFDETLAARLVGALADLYPGSVHVSEVGLAPASVVDPQLRGRGVERFWIADASIMPEVMIGERAAEGIRALP